MHTPEHPSPQNNHWDILALAIISLLMGLFVISAQAATDFVFGDTTWYMNRAQLIWRGVLSDQFVYTFGYPAFVGGIDLLLNNTITSGVVANMLLLFGLLAGIYHLGRLYYHRWVGWLAAIILLLNASFLFTLRVLEPNFATLCLLVWSLIAYHTLIRTRSIAIAIGLGLLTMAAMYVRLEQGMLAILIPLAGWMIYRQGGNWRQALRLVIIGLAIFAAGFFFYAYILLSRSDIGGGGAFSLIAQLTDTPVNWRLLSRRVSNMLTAIFTHWHPLVWWIAAAVLLWRSRRGDTVPLFLLGLVVYGFLVQFALVVWPFPIRGFFSLPLIALLLGWVVWTLWGWQAIGRAAAVILMLLACLPGFSQLAGYVGTPLRYQGDTLATDGAMLDDWIIAEGYVGHPIITACDRVVPFSTQNMQIIFRLDLTDPTRTDLPNSPVNILPELHQRDGLIMLCGYEPAFADWQAYFANPQAFEYQPVVVGQLGDYTFYGIVPNDET